MYRTVPVQARHTKIGGHIKEHLGEVHCEFGVSSLHSNHSLNVPIWKEQRESPVAS